MPNPLRKLPFQYQSQGKRMGGDEPPEASMRKGKPGRTKPSSRVKKKVKPGNKKFVEDLADKEDRMEMTGYQRAMRADNRGPQTRKRVIRREEDEFFKENPGRFGGKPDSPKVDANKIYNQLRANLSPKNQELLDILTQQYKNPPF